MFNFYRLYLWTLLITFFIPILDFPLYLYEIDIVALGKIPFVFLFIISFVYHLNKKIFFPSISFLFIFSLFLSIVLAVIFENSFSSAYFSHIYAFLMPIFSISFGYKFYNVYQNSIQIRSLFNKIILAAFYISFFLTFLYIYFFYITEQWSYYGFATALPLVFGYVYLRSPRLAHFGFIINILTGKRSSILVTLFFYIKKIKLLSILKKPIWTIILVPLLVYIFRKMDELEVFRRFELILDFDANDSIAIFMATGGRLTEVISVYDFFAESPIKFFTGSGLGAKYLFVDPRQMFPNALMHYTHFSPTFYVFLIGLPLTIIMYYFIFSQLKFANYKEPITYIFLSFMINSFFGSIMFVDPRFWFFFGCLLGYKKFKSTQYV